MNNSEVRAHLRKGELAVTVLETLGYRFETDPANTNREIWIAPAPVKKHKDLFEEALDPLIDSLRDLMFKEVARREEAVVRPQGPNWHIVKDLAGKHFTIRPENIPRGHDLYRRHVLGHRFKATSIEYVKNIGDYTGYRALFNCQFGLDPQVRTLWLPLSACAFSK